MNNTTANKPNLLRRTQSSTVAHRLFVAGGDTVHAECDRLGRKKTATSSGVGRDCGCLASVWQAVPPARLAHFPLPPATSSATTACWQGNPAPVGFAKLSENPTA